MRSLSRLLNRFRRDQRGNIAVIFAVATIPLISAVGFAIDYSEATRIRAKLQSAADAAAVASISQNSAGWLQASTMTSNGTVTAAQTAAMNIFNGNINGMIPTLFTLNTSGNPSPTAFVVTKTGANLTATVTFSANVPVTFLKVIGQSQFTVTGSSSANSSLPLYLDFYLTLDVSGSMGLPSTSSPNGGEAARMQYVNPDNYRQYPTGCTLACHFPQQNSACTDTGTQGYPTNGYCLGYMISRVSQSGFWNLLQQQSPQGTYPFQDHTPGSSTFGKYFQLPSTLVSGLPNSLNNKLTPVTSCPTAGTDACIQLRLDAVGMAVTQLLSLANTKQIINNQFRVGLYPFIEHADTSYAPLTTSYTGAMMTSAASNLAQELDTNTNSNLGSGGTHIDVALNDINKAINNGTGNVGNGSSSTNTLPYVFLVTDGAQDPQMKVVPNGGWSGSNHAVTLDNASNSFPGICTTLKNRGIMVSVLNIPYQPINPVNSSFANDEDDFANNNIPNIKNSLQTCASPPDAAGSYYYEGNTPAEINTALQAMFNHALVTAHITN
jgi:Flp pilus assembly protein TadG